MSWWNAKYKNGHGEYEITFASKDYEKAKVVEKVCQAIIDKRIKSTDELPPFLSGKDKNVRTNADHIRSMTDEELAGYISENCISDFCYIVCGGDCKAMANLNKTSAQVCQEIVSNWLKQPWKETK